MRQPWLVSLLVVAAALGGYAAGAHPLEARAEPFPFSAGDKVAFTMPDTAIRPCEVAEVRGMLVRCTRPETRAIGVQVHRGGEYWMNVSAMLGIEVMDTP